MEKDCSNNVSLNILLPHVPMYCRSKAIGLGFYVCICVYMCVCLQKKL